MAVATDTPSNIQIAFPKVSTGSTALAAIPSAPVTPVNDGLAQFAANPVEVKTRLVCKDLLQGDTLAQAQAMAEQMYPQMKSSTQAYLTFGSGALEDMNALVDSLLKEIAPVTIPELKELMHDLNAGMHGIQKKYDVSDPAVREKYEHWKGGIGRFFGHAKTLLDLFLEDITSIERQLDKVKRECAGREDQLLHNVGYYDRLYTENETTIDKVIFVIAVMEMIVDLAAHEIETIPVGDQAAGDRGSENRAKLAEFAQNLQVKIGDYKGRLMIAWATAPQVRMMRSLSVGVAVKLDTMIDTTIPSMKLTLAQWRLAIQTGDAAELTKLVTESGNEWVQAYFRSAGELVPKIADAVQTPALSPQTIAAMAQAIAKEADDIVTAMAAGDQRRAEMENAMNQALPVLRDANTRVSDALINQVVGAATKPLQIAQSVPATDTATAN